MTTERKKYCGDESSTAQIIDFLLSKGFKQNEDFDSVQETGARWLTFSIVDYVKDMDLDINLDFDPYMHIDETDDDICYDCPVYVQFQDNDRCNNFYSFSDPEYITGIKDLEQEVNDYIAEKTRLYEIEEND